MHLQLNYDVSQNCVIVKGPGMATELSVPLDTPEYDPSLVQSVM